MQANYKSVLSFFRRCKHDTAADRRVAVDMDQSKGGRACCRCVRRAAVDRYRLQQTRRTPQLRRKMRRIDRRTDAQQFHRPCSATIRAVSRVS